METGKCKPPKKPPWLKKKVSLNNKNILEVKNLLQDLSLNTVCQSARCPNIFECFSNRTATFMLMGAVCTRNCAFCGIDSGRPLEPDIKEPQKIAIAAKEMDLRYVVLTSVTRDDLPDGGANHFLNTIRQIKKELPGSFIECLIPDLRGKKENLAILLAEKFEVLNHNIETIKRNYHRIRTGADYEVSLDILRSAKKIRPDIVTKSGFMVGLGESRKEVIQLLVDLKEAGIDILTIGQYLQPSAENISVQKYYSPDEFKGLRDLALNTGFRYVVSGVFVRSSYRAAIAFKAVRS